MTYTLPSRISVAETDTQRSRDVAWAVTLLMSDPVARPGSGLDDAATRSRKHPCAEIVSILLEAGAPVPERVGGEGSSATLIAELGIDPPA